MKYNEMKKQLADDDRALTALKEEKVDFVVTVTYCCSL